MKLLTIFFMSFLALSCIPSETKEVVRETTVCTCEEKIAAAEWAKEALYILNGSDEDITDVIDKIYYQSIKLHCKDKRLKGMSYGVYNFVPHEGQLEPGSEMMDYHIFRH